MTSPKITKRQILVAVNSFESRLTISAALSEQGYSVATVSNGLAAYNFLTDSQFDLVVLDTDMEETDSAQLCSLIRQASSIPIIIFSESDEIARKLAAFDSGADDFIVKGTSFEEVLARVNAILRRYDSAGKAPPETWEPKIVQGQKSDKQVKSRPLNQTAIDSIAERQASRLTLQHRYRPREYKAIKGVPVLIVDANANDRLHAARLLKQLNYFPLEADSGYQGLLTVKKYRPVLVIADLMLPDLNALEFIKVLKAHPTTQDVKIIVASAKGDPGSVEAATELGIDDYIIKPVLQHELAIRTQWLFDTEAAA